MIEALVIVDQDQNQEGVQTEIEYDFISVGNMITLLKIVQWQKKKGKQSKYNSYLI